MTNVSQPRRLTVFTPAAALAATLLAGAATLTPPAAHAASAQEASQATQPPPPRQSIDRPRSVDDVRRQVVRERDNSPLVSIDFAGGTVGDYFAELQRVNPSVQVVLPQENARFAMPPVHLTDVSLDHAALLPATVTSGAVNVIRQPFGQTDSVSAPFYVVLSGHLSPELISSMVTIDFPGGTVAEYVDAIRQSSKSASILVMPNAADLQMPAVQFSAARVNDVVKAVRHADPTGRTIVVFEGDVAVISRTGGGSAQASPFDENTTIATYVWPMTMLLDENGDASAALSAIEAALALNGPGVDIAYHEGTKLLMARGSFSRLQEIERTIDALQKASGSEERDTDRRLRASQRVTDQALIQNLQNQVAQLQREKAELERRLAEAEARTNEPR